jgi:hypothetical protein
VEGLTMADHGQPGNGRFYAVLICATIFLITFLDFLAKVINS